MAGFGEQLAAAAPIFLGIGSQASGRDPAGIARGFALMEAKQERDQRKAAIENMMSGMGISGSQKSFLSSLPVEAQQQYILQQMAPKEPVRGVAMGDRLVDPYTGATIANYGPEPLPANVFGGDYSGGLDPYLVGGGTRPDAITGLDGGFRSNVERMIADAPPEIRGQLRITSAFRSPDTQAMLFERAVAKYGSEDAARKWVAPPGRSKHNHGSAIDFKYLSPEAQKWAHENAARYGLHFPMEHEPWHVEPVGSRGGAQPHQQAQAMPQVAQLDTTIDRMTAILATGRGTDAQRKQLEFKRSQLVSERDRLRAQSQAEHERALEAAGKPPFDTDLANTYRDDMRGEPALTLFGDVQSGFDAIEQFYTSPGAVSDYALAVAFAKIVDPGSVAREGEVAAVSSAAGAYPAFEQALKNAITREGKMPTEMRQEIADLGAKLYSKKADRASTVLDSYRRRADRAKIPFDEIWANGPITPLPDDWLSTIQVEPNAVTRFAPEQPATPAPVAPQPAAPMGAAMAQEAPLVASTVAPTDNLPTEEELAAAIDGLTPGQIKVLSRLKPKDAVEYLRRLGKLK